MNFEEMKNVLEKYNQNHVVLAYERADEEKYKLLVKINGIEIFFQIILGR